MSHTRQSVSTLEMFYQQETSHPEKVYLQQPVDGQWHSYTWKDVGDQARRIAAALRSMSIGNGERICILSKNCAHWLIADIAIMMSGGASAPAFTTMTAEDVLYILDHSQSKVLIVGQTDNWQELKDVLPNDIQVISLPFTNLPEIEHNWNSLLTTFEPLTGNPKRSNDEELTTIYTSGSTGKPKGVMYSFEGAGHVAINLSETFRTEQNDRFMSYLPLAHGFERALIGWMSMKSGFTIGFNENQATFANDIKTIEPTVFHSIPRLWIKFQQGVIGKFGGQSQLSSLLSDPDQHQVTKEKIRQALGLSAGRLFLTGSAPTPIPVHEWYDALDIPLCEIYGQSEILSGTSNLPWDRKPGTLGKPTKNTQIKISDIGEILIKAKAAMTGYLHEPEKTTETIIDGWTHTGDKGEIDKDGFLKITGRVKEIFKTDKGKYVAPVPIEGNFVSNPFLEQVCLMGSGLPQTSLTVQLSPEGLQTDPTLVETALHRDISKVNAELDKHARIGCVIISNSEWNSENRFVTHTLKIKRSTLEKHYTPIAKKIFDTSKAQEKLVIFWEK